MGPEMEGMADARAGRTAKSLVKVVVSFIVELLDAGGYEVCGVWIGGVFCWVRRSRRQFGRVW